MHTAKSSPSSGLSLLMLAAGALTMVVCGLATPALATVEGTPPTLFRSFRVFGTHVATGNTLMSNTPSQPLVNSILLEESSAAISTIPTGSTVEGAFIFWSGSIQGRPDRQVTFRLADGFETTVSADTCFTSPALDGFFYCRADVTELLEAHPVGPGNFNGLYSVGDVNARPGLVDENGQCIDINCQARYGGWSIVVVYNNDNENTQRDIILYDGFRQLDETPGSPGIDDFVIDSFEVANPPQGTFTFFGLEGDALLGVPPQDQDPNPQLRCSDCVDFIAVNGVRLSDPNNPPGNLFNSTTPTGGSLGIDIDTFDISNLVRTGDTSVTVEVGSGDGIPSVQGGGGESVFLGYVVISLNRLSPNFSTQSTIKTVDPDEAGPGETVFFDITVTNDGSLSASNVVVQDVLDPRFEYVAGSTRLDGVAVPDVGGRSALQNGLRLGTVNFEGDNDRRISFRARVVSGTPSGSRIPNSATIRATELPEPATTNQVFVTVVAPTLGQPTKAARDTNGGDLEPGDIVAYTVFIPNNSGRTASGVRFVDDIAPFGQLLGVTPTNFIDASDPNGGLNGRGRVEIQEIVIPAAVPGVFISYNVRIDSAEELIANGVQPEDIDGLAIFNQGRVQADFLLTDLFTDDPGTAPTPDPTIIRLVSAVNFRNPATFKRGEDINAEPLVPGDVVRYTLSLSNAGNADAVVNLDDSLPPFVEGFTLVDGPPQVTFAPAPAGDNNTGLVTIRNLTVPGRSTITVLFTVQISDDAPGGTRITNAAELAVRDVVGQDQTLTSETLIVVAGAILDQSTKEIENPPPGGFQPGDTVNYVLTVINSGNRPGTNVVVQDNVALNLTDVVPADGGVFDVDQRRITWNLGDMPSGDARQLRFTAQLVSPLADGTVIRNQGVISADNVDGRVVTDDPSTVATDDSTNFVVSSEPELSTSTKTVEDLNGGSFEPGDPVRYVLAITNTGRDSARQVVVSDPIDERIEIDTIGEGGTQVGGQIVWAFATTPGFDEIQPGETVEVSFTATLAAPLDNGIRIPNQGFVRSLEIPGGVPTDDPDTPELGDPTIIEISAEAVLSASTKAVEDNNGGAVQPGDVLTYTISIQNDGSGSARDTVVVDPIAVELTGVTPEDGGVFDPDTRIITWSLAGPVPPNSIATVSFQARVADGTVNGTVISNQATISSRDVPDDVLTDDPSNGLGDDDPTNVTVEARPDFVNSSKAVQNESNPGEGFVPGDVALYIINVRNSGTQDATGVTVSDTISDVLINIGAESGGVVVGQNVTWTLPLLAAGDDVELRVRGTVPNPLDDGVEVSNQAFITSAEIAEPVPTDDPNTPEEDDATIFVVTSQPILVGSRKLVEDENGGSARPGDTVLYTIELINSGSSTARNVVVTDQIDTNLENIEPLDGGSFDNGVLTWSAPATAALAAIAPDGDVAIPVRFRATVAGALPNGTLISNQAVINADGLEEPALTDDPRTVDFGDPTVFPVVSASDLNSATKAVDPPDDGQYNPGDRVFYTLAFTNEGDAPAENVVVTDSLDENLIFVSASDGGTLQPPQVVWNAQTTPALAQVDPGQTVILRIEAAVTSPVDNGTIVFNQGRITADGFVNAVLTDDPETPELDDPTLIEVSSSAELSNSTKTVRDLDADGFFEPGDVVEYVITIQNQGDDTARNVVVNDTVDTDQLTQVTPLDGGRLQGDTVTWDAAGVPVLAAVRPGDSGRVVVRFRATISPLATNGARISNQAFVGADDLAPEPTDDPVTPAVDDTTDLVVTAEARFDGMTKSVQDINGGLVEAGDRLRYTIEVINEGTEVGRGVVVNDEVNTNLVDIAPANGGQLLGQTVRWTLGDLLPGQRLTVAFEATVRGNTVDGTAIPNQAVLTATGIGGVLSDDPSTGLGDDDPTVVVVNARPDITTFDKTVRDINGGFIEPGDLIEFNIDIRNTGRGAAREVVIRDPLDTSLLQDIVPGQRGRLQAGVVTWTQVEEPLLASIPPGTAIRVTVQARIRPEVPNGTILLNQANANAADVPQSLSNDPTTRQDDDPTRVEVRFPEFGPLVKSFEDLDGGLIEAGDRVRYTLIVQANPNGESLSNVRIVDPISENLIDIEPFNGGSFNELQNQIIWNSNTVRNLGLVQPGQRIEIGFTATINPEAQAGTRIANLAQATSTSIPNRTEDSDDPRNGLGDRDPTVITVEAVPLADLGDTEKRVTDDNGGVVQPGDVLTYTIITRNTGRSNSSELTLVDPVPALTNYVPNSTRRDGQQVSDVNGQSPLISGFGLPPLGVGQEVQVSFQVTVRDGAPRGSIISNQGVVTDAGGQQALTDDPTTANPDDATTIIVGAAPNMSGARKIARIIDSNNNGVLDAGEQLEYEIRVPNRGNIIANGVLFRDTLNNDLRYVANSTFVNGQQFSDADDGDIVSFITNTSTVQVLLGSIEPGQAPVVRFRATVLRGDADGNARNQGIITGGEFSPELTDADGNEANGNQPTINAVGPGALALDVAKSVNDVNGGDVDPGDQLIYTITVGNPGRQTATGVQLTDPLPAGTVFSDILASPPGSDVDLTPSLLVSGFDIPGGESRTVAFRVTIGEGLERGTVLCNTARANSSNGARGLTPEAACVTVGGVVGASRIFGRVFEDVGERDRVFSEGDNTLEDFLVRLYRPSNPTVAVAEAVTDAQGQYALPLTVRGDYILKALTRPGGSGPVEFARLGEIRLNNGAAVEQDVFVDPSGRIYNSITGAVINGAEVQIFYADDDPDPTRAGRLVPPEDLPENQQSQLTRDGLYKFDVLPGHRYRLEVVSPSVGLIFPSERIPAEARRWDPDTDPNEVVDNEFPDVSGASPQTWFLSFDIRGPQDEVLNNHIPLDPIASLIRLDKRSNKKSATVGEIISYTITVANGSSRDLVFDQNTNTGGVLIRDVVPRGFDYVKGSGRLRRKDGGRVIGSDIAEPAGELTLSFGVSDPENPDGRPRPLSLGAGESLELQYQLVAGSDVAPGKVYTNRAVLVSADGSTPLSNEDEARVKLVHDPIFDQGIALGKVFCDDNGDGWQDPGEKGVFKARVYLDNGWYAVTDKAGQFHFQAIDPGNHLIKLDTNTLPPGAEPTTDIRRIFYVTRGLPVKLSFGAVCPTNIVDEVDVNASKELIEEQEARMRANFVTIAGDVDERRLAVGEKPVSMPGAMLTAQAGDKADAPLIFDAESGKFDAPLFFAPAIEGGPEVESWHIRIERYTAKGPVHVISGEGTPPSRVKWEGLGHGGKALVVSGPAAYTAVLTARGVGGAMTVSAPVVFGVSGRDKSLVAEEMLNGELFKKRRADMSEDLQTRLRKIKRGLRSGRLYIFEIEVHTDDQQDKADKLKKLTDQRAAKIKGFVTKDLGIKAEDVKVQGFGGSRPLVPNIGERNLFLNNRVEVRVIDPNPDIIKPSLPTIEPVEPSVFVNDKSLPIDGEGAFSKMLLRPGDGLLVVAMRTPDGGLSVRRININEGAIGLKTPRIDLPRVRVIGDMKAGTIKVGKQTFKPALLGVAVSGERAEVSLDQGTLKPPASFKVAVDAKVKVDQYLFEIRDQNGTVVHTKRGGGSVPANVQWGGAVDQDRTFLIPGWYQASLLVFTSDGQVGRSSVTQFRLKPVATKPARRAPRKTAEQIEAEKAAAVAPKLDFKRQAFINGEKVGVNTSGGFRSDIEAHTGQQIIVEVQGIDGSRAVLHLTVPDGHPKPDELEPGGAQPVMGGDPFAPGAPGAPSKPKAEPEPAKDTAPDAEKAPDETGGEEIEEEEETDDNGLTIGEEEEPQGAAPIRNMPIGLAPGGPIDLTRRPTMRMLLAQDDTVGSDAGDAKAEAVAESGGPAGLSTFGADRLDEALRDLEEVNVDKEALESPAANLKVNLPAQGTVLQSRELVVTGSTDPTNKISVNGRDIEVVDGEFIHAVKLPLGESEIVIQTEDIKGNVGEIRWPVEVAESAYFLMAFADTAVITEGAELDGLHDHNSLALDGGTILYGQAKLYLKGYQSGREILDSFFEEYRYTAFVDTARQAEFEAFLTDTIDPNAYYPIYGDASETVRDADGQGKLYLMLEADESKMRFGSIRPNIEGVQFFRYDRPMYGAMVDFNKVMAEDYKTEVKAFASADGTFLGGEQRVQHTWNYLQGTGGSLYWLRHGEVVEGSEQITVVVRDEASGVELARIPQSRHADYNIDYRTGRVLFKSPVPSHMSGAFMTSRINTTHTALEGNPVVIEVSYDYEAELGVADTSWGGQLRQTFYDTFHIGGGIVEESRGAETDYTLWGFEAGLKASERTKLLFEYAGSEAQDALSLFSSDGGLTFDGFSRRTGEDKDGNALSVSARVEFGDFIFDEETGPEEFFAVRGYFQDVTTGFFSSGTIMEQGQNKFGGDMTWIIDDSNTLKLRYDGLFTQVDDFEEPNPETLKELERHVTTVQHKLMGDGWRLVSEYNHTFYDDATRVDGDHTDIIGERLSYDFSEHVTAYIGQQWVIRGDPRIYDEDFDKLQTDVGLQIKMDKDWSFEISESLRWNGVNATQIGLTTNLSPDSSVYIRERITTREDNVGQATTTVVGGETRFAEGSGRVYSEYQIDAGLGGDQTRSIVGIGKHWKLTETLSLDAAYERSTTKVGTGVGNNSRDVVSGGWQYLGKNVKIAQKLELRYDDADAQTPQANPCFTDGVYTNPDFCRDNLPGGMDKLQVVTTNAFALKFWEDHNLLAQWNFSTTENITLDREEARFMAASFGYALRPVSWDWMNLLVKYTYLQNMRPIDLLGGTEEREHAHVFSLVPIFETPIGLQFVEKLAFKRQFVRFDNLPEAESDTILAISRVNYHLTDMFDVGLEYRFMQNSLANDLKHGALFEFSYILMKHARLGVGYNFTSFSDDELSDLDRDVGGFFFRLQGQY